MAGYVPVDDNSFGGAAVWLERFDKVGLDSKVSFKVFQVLTENAVELPNQTHAHWIPKGDFGGYAKMFVCSNCGKEIETENWTNAPEDEFCRHCGAIMDEKGAG